MAYNNREIKDRIDKFRKMYEHTQGGIFWNRTRDKLLTKEGISEKGRSVNTFWYRQRENVKTALIDLQLFIDTATEKNVNQVFNEETLKPLVDALLYRYKPNSTKTKIAQLFIQTGFSYLRQATLELLTASQREAIDETIDLSKQLTVLALPSDEQEKYRLRLGRRMW